LTLKVYADKRKILGILADYFAIRSVRYVTGMCERTGVRKIQS